MISKVQGYIKELLYNNDCVIIPELGGFVTSYQSSQIHPIKHHFAPPSKRIAFNQKLVLNDGLLISYIANAGKTSIQNATEQVDKFVSEVQAKIKAKEKVILDGIGVLFKNEEGRLQFKAEKEDNFLEDSFGLPDFFSNPIIRDNKNTRLRNKFKDRKAMSKEEVKKEEKEVKKKGGATVWVLTAIVVLLCISATYLFVVDKGENNMLSSLFPFGKKEQPSNEIAADTMEVESDSTLYRRRRYI